MSDVNKEVKQEETNSLAPIPEKDRIMGLSLIHICTFFKLLKDYKARYMGIGKVDKDMALFYEDKKEKEEK